ncbi:hypothetical protein GCM10028807_60450 [Spirosoma daeguense]
MKRIRTGILYHIHIIPILILAAGFWACHEEPSLPNTLIPPSCYVGRLDFVDTTSRYSATYTYDSFGNRTGSVDELTKETRTYKLDTERQYVLSQDVNGTALTYQYDEAVSPKRISKITGGSFSYEYTYEGSGLQLKTFASKEGNTTKTYTFTGGKLTGLAVNPASATYEIKDEKISKITDTQGNVTNLTYTSGQITQAEYVYTSGLRRLVTYTYDDKFFYANSGLYVRGFPRMTDTGQPGPGLNDIGYPFQKNNFKTVTTKVFRGTTEISSQTLVYQHQYNQVGYSLGFARSDGARARFFYANCPNN